MAHKALTNLRMGATWTTYIASVDGVLRAAGWWQEETYRLMGMTGMAFHFIMHKQACPSSVTVYDWIYEHLQMMDLIGIHSEVYQAHYGMNTFTQMQVDAVERIKASIDRGVGVVTWAPTPVLEFGIISGYDDADGVFLVEHCLPEPAQPLLYANLGRSEVPILFYQIFRGKIEVKPDAVYRGSLQFSLRQWGKQQHVQPDYASGRKAYNSLIATLERKDFDPFGLSYNLQVYASAKGDLSRYLDSLVAESSPYATLEQAAKLYHQVAENYVRITSLVPFRGPAAAPDAGAIPVTEVLGLVRTCKALEEQAIQVIERFVGA